MLGLYLCSKQPNEILLSIKPEWNATVAWPPTEKYTELNIFPFINELSDAIPVTDFVQSHLYQPQLFLRVRPGFEQTVHKKLTVAAIPFNNLQNGCLCLPNEVNADKVLLLNKEAVVQDYSTQQLASFLLHVKNASSGSILKVWDCCAASGGKSILAVDCLGNIDLTVSDIRKKILINLKNRFKEAGISCYKSFVHDLSKPGIPVKKVFFDLIIADVPCSGSGTWGRTPEQLLYFTNEKIEVYVKLQRSILTNIVRLLPAGGYLLYSTCSVFKKENEEMLEWLQQQYGLTLLQQQTIVGFPLGADSFFGALLQEKPNK